MQASQRLRLPLVAAFLVAVSAIVFGASKAGPSQSGRAAGLPLTLSAQKDYGNLPLAFEPNVGQVDPQVRFLTHSPDMTVYFTDSEAVMVLHKRAPSKTETAVVRMKLAGAGKPGRTAGLDKLPGISNYFIGKDPAKWRTDIPNYARIRYNGVYPGVDLVAYGNERQLEYDLVVASEADPRQIELAWEGADRLELNQQGDLVLSTRLGDVVQKRPRVYQETGRGRIEVGANYALGADKHVRFQLARYDRTRPLVIDPVTVVYSSYLGYSSQGTAIAVDSTGAAYVTGYTYDSNFPVVSPYQSTNKDVNGSGATTFVSKISATGNALVYSTYLGGKSEDDPNGIAVDSSGSAYIVGTAWSLTSFPTSSAFQSSCSGNYKNGVYVTKLSAAGNSLAYSTYLCGKDGSSDYGAGIAVDAAGSAYVTGYTNSSHWPLQSPYQSQNNAGTTGFVTKLAPAGNSLVYSTYLGGTGEDQPIAIAVDSSNAAYVTGKTWSTDFPLTASAFQTTNKSSYGNPTTFVTKLSPAGTTLAYSTYLGGSSSYQVGDTASGITVDSTGAAAVTGVTGSKDFPLQSPIQSTNKNVDSGTCFVTKLATGGNSLIYSTYLGGSETSGPSGDVCDAIAVDSAREVFVTGTTNSADFPLLSPLQASLSATNVVFVTKFSATGALSYSTFFGGSGDSEAFGIAADSAGAAYITGLTGDQTDFPLTNAFQKTTSTSGGPFVAKLQNSGGATTTIATIPAGLTVTVDGVNYTAPQPFGWTAGTSHSISVSSPQAGPTGVRYAFANWSDSGLQIHSVTASSSGATYTATFTTQYELNTNVSPSGGGTITANPPSADGFYNSGTSVQLTAIPNSGYTFTGWSGDLSGTTNPQSISMTAVRNVTVNFSGTALPDLVITALTAQTTATAGGQITINNLTVVNQGNADAGYFIVKFYFSTTPNIAIATAIDTTAYCHFDNGAAAGSTHTCNNGSIRVPSGLTSGTWYLGAIIDPTNQITESNKNNNARVADSGPVQVTAAGLVFYPVPPCRVADTRGNGFSGTFGPPSITGGTSRDFKIPASNCNIPYNAGAYSLNVTVVPPGALTYISMWPTALVMPTVSTLNDFSTQMGTPGNVVANAAIVPAGSAGAVSVFASDTSDVIIDINGYFAPPGTGGLAFYPLKPCRVADTRSNGFFPQGTWGPPTMAASATRTFPIPQSSCAVPSTAQAYSLNMTAVPPGQLIYLTTWPSDQSQPTVSTLNNFSLGIPAQAMGKVVANAAIVPAAANGSVSVFVNDPSDVVIDINGYFAPPGSPGALSFYVATPCRIADTRSNGFFPLSGSLWGPPTMAANATRTFPIPQSSCVVPSTAQAYSLNMAVLPPNQLTWLTIWPNGQSQPTVSTLNDFSTGTVVPGRVVANAAIVPAGTSGSVNVFVSNQTDVIIDINGYFAP